MNLRRASGVISYMPPSRHCRPGRRASAAIASPVGLRHCLLPLLIAAALAAAGCRPGGAGDPLAAEVQRLSTMLRLHAVTDRGWAQLERAARPSLESVQEALRQRRRLLALTRLVEVRVGLGVEAYARSPAARRRTAGAFEAEWARLGGPLRDDLGPPSPGALSGVRPAAARAIGEAAVPQVRAYYRASLEYARSTMPQNGYSYLGTAQALQQLVAFCRTLAPSFPARRQPELRTLGAELDGLDAEVVAAYRPPAALRRHDDFIYVGSLLKEARELDAAGLRYGALLRYLQATFAMRPLRPAAPPPDARALSARLRELDARLAASRLDDSIGRLYLETAQAYLDGGAASGSGAGAASAAAIVDDVLPRYFTALGPAPRATPRPAPTVTVTLLRWPYT
jgi:hypothetical protein